MKQELFRSGALKRRPFRKNTNIWEPEDVADKLYFAESGSVRIIQLNSDGSEFLLRTVGAQEFFGESCLTGQKTARKTIARTVENCLILEFSAAEFFSRVKKNVGLLEFFIASLSKKLVSAERHIRR